MNNCNFTGRLTETPTLSHTPSGTAICHFTIATNRMRAKDAETAKADFIRCVAWNNTAEYLCKYYEKGSPVAVCGSLQTGSYDDNETGIKMYTWEINIANIYPVGVKLKSE